ncbi:MAG: hypothetical protein VB143_07135 [Burkholderia sp.]
MIGSSKRGVLSRASGALGEIDERDERVWRGRAGPIETIGRACRVVAWAVDVAVRVAGMMSAESRGYKHSLKVRAGA